MRGRNLDAGGLGQLIVDCADDENLAALEHFLMDRPSKSREEQRLEI